MRILYLCHRVPYPPDKGDKIRAFHQLKAISARHTVDLFTLADTREDLEHESALRQYCETVSIERVIPALARVRTLRFLFTGRPLTIPYFFSRRLEAKVQRALATRRYDRVFVYCSAMAQYVDSAEAPAVMDLVDVDSDKWNQYAAYSQFPLSWIYRREANTLRRYERTACVGASAVVVTTEREAALARELAPAASVHVIPNGVDRDYFAADSAGNVPAAPTVSFTGDMSYFPNEQAVVFFANEVLPLIRKAVPETRFLIVGRRPTRKVQSLRAMEGVEVTGFVPDVRPYLAQSMVAVAPFLIAAGIQNKVLEAMSFGLPVVATSKIGCSLPKNVAELIEFGDRPVELASKVVGLLRDPERRRRVGAEGRRRVSEEYDWARSLDELLNLLENPVSSDRLSPAPSSEVQAVV